MLIIKCFLVLLWFLFFFFFVACIGIGSRIKNKYLAKQKCDLNFLCNIDSWMKFWDPSSGLQDDHEITEPENIWLFGILLDKFYCGGACKNVDLEIICNLKDEQLTPDKFETSIFQAKKTIVESWPQNLNDVFTYFDERWNEWVQECNNNTNNKNKNNNNKNNNNKKNSKTSYVFVTFVKLLSDFKFFDFFLYHSNCFYFFLCCCCFCLFCGCCCCCCFVLFFFCFFWWCLCIRSKNNVEK